MKQIFKISKSVLMLMVFAISIGYAYAGNGGDNPTNCNLNGYVTFTQGGWGSPANGNNPGTIRDAYFAAVFPNGLTIGYGSNTATFTSAAAIQAYLPAGGKAGKLTGTLINPTSTKSGVLGGQVTALMLSVYFDAAGYIGTNPGNLGDLVIVSGPFAGYTVYAFLDIANKALGGLNTGFSFSAINAAATALNENFDDGTVNKNYVTCGNPVLGSIGDFVWFDTNHNGIQDAGEQGISGVVVKLYDCNNTLISTTTTNASGGYLFSNLPAGSYYVEFIAPAGYTISPKDAGSNDLVDSDADPVTGKTICFTLGAGNNDLTRDAGMYVAVSGAELEITKVADFDEITCGQNVSYTITVKNNGPASANLVKVNDVLPLGLVYLNSSASQGSYDNNSGDWTVGTLANGASATLSIGVQVDCNALASAAIDLGPAKDYNVFVLGDFTAPSSDTQGKLAAGGNFYATGYSVGDQLPVSSPAPDVLVVGGNLTFLIGGVYGGNVVYGGTSNLPTNTVSIINGDVRHEPNMASVLDFASAASYLENLSVTLGSYPVNGTTYKEWGSVNMEGTDPYLNVFEVNGSDISAAHTVKISVPNGSVVLVNILGTSVEWKGGLFVYGTAIGNVLYNFPQATALTIFGIDVRGSILAPFADVNFISGVQHGQMIAKSVTGQGQFNLAPYHGNIPQVSIINVASITNSDQNDPVSGNNSATETVSFASNSGGNGGGSGSGNWQLVGNLPSTEIIMSIVTDASNNIYAAAITGFIYKSTDGGLNWFRTNENMYSGPVWALKVHNSGAIFAASVSGVYKSVNGTDWSLTTLQNLDVRSIESDNSGNLYAGTWSSGIYKSTDLGLTWNEANTGMPSGSIITSMTLTPNQNIYTGTFGNGVNKSSDFAASWSPASLNHDYIWTMASNSLGHIFAGTYGEGIYRSVNNGATWVRTSFPATHIYSLIIDAEDNIYASSYTAGVYVSSDNGETWSNVGLAGYNVSSLMINPNGSTVYAATKSGQVYKLVENTTSAKEIAVVPTELKLSQNYPNPFNPTTRIEVSLPRAGNYKLVVYDMIGQAVATLLNGQVEAGNHTVQFDGTGFSSGIYIYKLTGENVNISKKMMMVK